jgi:hypothetical protein
VSLTPEINIHSRISPRIFEKIPNGPQRILMGPGTLIHEKNRKSKISCQTPFKKLSMKKIFWRFPLQDSFYDEFPTNFDSVLSVPFRPTPMLRQNLALVETKRITVLLSVAFYGKSNLLSTIIKSNQKMRFNPPLNTAHQHPSYDSFYVWLLQHDQQFFHVLYL